MWRFFYLEVFSNSKHLFFFSLIISLELSALRTLKYDVNMEEKEEKEKEEEKGEEKDERNSNNRISSPHVVVARHPDDFNDDDCDDDAVGEEFEKDADDLFSLFSAKDKDEEEQPRRCERYVRR